jgi:lysophospholipase L1-like esterase
MSSFDKTIFVYGDSNSYGYDPITQLRFPYSYRWVNLLKDSELENKFEVVNESLNGRTTQHYAAPNDSIFNYNINGKELFLTFLHSHKPIHTVILALNINDFKHGSNPENVLTGIQSLIDIILSENEKITTNISKLPYILVMGPPPVFSTRLNEVWGFPKNLEVEVKKLSQLLDSKFKNGLNNVCYLDMMDVDGISIDATDGIHYTIESQSSIAAAVVQKLFYIWKT